MAFVLRNKMYYKTPPRDHQREFVENLYHLRRIGNYDAPGAGKTKMVLDVIQNKPNLDQVIVFLPGRLKETWLNEMEIHYSGRYPISFVGYEMLSRRDVMPLWPTRNTLLVFDESHMIKNSRSKRGKRLVKFFANYDCQVITLTGTPKSNGNQDLYMQGGLLDLPCGQIKESVFLDIYCEFRDGPFGQVWVADRYTEQLMSQFSKVAVFRKKEDMLSLPEKIYTPIYYTPHPKIVKATKELNKEGVYLFEQLETTQDQLMMAKKHIMNTLRVCSGYLTVEDEYENKTLNTLVPIKQNPKFQALLALADTFPKEEKFIILTAFRIESEEIASVLKEVGYDVLLSLGGVDRVANLENTFNKGSTQVLVATIQSVDTGFTLTSASRMIYYSNTYQAVHRIQSEDRIHRIGQERTCVYYDLVAKGYADEAVMLKVKNKMRGSEAFFDLFKQITTT